MLSKQMESSSRWLSAGLLVAVGGFQWTRMKNACQRQCRSPLDFIMTEWREGRWGALVMGLRHGMFCVGCCWLLMCVLFVTGVMNLAWVAIITGFVLLERIVPWHIWLNRASGALLIVWGIYTAVA